MQVTAAYMQAVSDRVMPRLMRYLGTHRSLTLHAVSQEEWYKDELPVDIACVVGRATELGVLAMKYKWDDREELYDSLDDMLGHGSRTSMCMAVWTKGRL